MCPLNIDADPDLIKFEEWPWTMKFANRIKLHFTVTYLTEI